MAHNRTTHYSAPYRRNNLLGLHQYAASEGFVSLGTWDRAKNDDMYVVRGTSGRSNPVSITVVGAITSDKAHLQPHGNYNASYMTLEEVPKKARLQFYISSPADDPDFSADYALAIKRLKAIQDEVATSPARREHFIEGLNMKMNFLLFSEKEYFEQGKLYRSSMLSHPFADILNAGRGMPFKPEPDSDIEMEDGETERQLSTRSVGQTPYEVASPYKDIWDTISSTHHNNVMQVYGTDEMLVDYRRFPKILAPGTTVVVSFTLKHYSIREKANQPPSDTYSAFVHSISVLKPAEKIIRPTVIPKRRPLLVPQLPSRSMLKLAADTFSPVRKDGINTTVKPTRDRGVSDIPSAVSGQPHSTTDIGTQTTVESTKLPAKEPTNEEESQDDMSGSVNSLPLSVTRDLMSVLYPLLIRELKNPESKTFKSILTGPIGRGASPIASSSSTISSTSDDTPQPVKEGRESWVDVSADNEVSEDPNRTVEQEQDAQSDDFYAPEMSSVPNDSALSPLSSSEDDTEEPAEEEVTDGKARKKGKSVNSANRKGKKKKAT